MDNNNNQYGNTPQNDGYAAAPFDQQQEPKPYAEQYNAYNQHNNGGAYQNGGQPYGSNPQAPYEYQNPAEPQYQPYGQPYQQPYQNQPYGYDNGYQQPQYQPAGAQPVKTPGKGFGIASLVLSICSYVLCCCCPYLVMPVLGLIFGIVSRVKSGGKNGMALVGIILSSIAIGLAIVYWVLFTTGALSDIFRNMDIDVPYYYY